MILTNKTLFKELKKFNIEYLENYSLDFKKNRHINSSKLNKLDLFSNISSDIEKVFINLNDDNLYFINKELMLVLNGPSFRIIDNYGYLLGSFSCNFEANHFQMHGNNFMYTLSYGNTRKNEILYNFTNDEEELYITIKKNKFIIDSSNSNITSIEFKKDSYFIEFNKEVFKNKIFSSILFDKDFNIKEMELSKNIIEDLKLNKKYKIINFKYQKSLINSLEFHLKDQLDLYKLVYDKKYMLIDPECSISNEINKIKSIIKNKNEFSDLYKNNKKNIDLIKDYYKEFMIKNSRLRHLLNELEKSLILKSSKKITHDIQILNELGINSEIIKEDIIFDEDNLFNILILSTMVLKEKYLAQVIHPEILNLFNTLSENSSSLFLNTKDKILNNKIKKT